MTSYRPNARPGISRELPGSLPDQAGRGVYDFRGSGFHAIKAGRYLTSASLEKERGYGIGLFDRTVDLAKGNQSVLVDINARNFYRLDDGTRLFLRDLAITREEDVIDEIPEAWSSGEINFGG